MMTSPRSIAPKPDDSPTFKLAAVQVRPKGPRPILPKPDKSAVGMNLELNTNADVMDEGADPQLAPPVLTPETEFEKLLQEETARFNLPLALRKSPRASAGMKYSLLQEETMAVDESLIFREPTVKSTKIKEIKLGTKRKLDLGSEPSVKTPHHHKHKDKHKERHKDKHKEKHRTKESKISMEDYVAPSSKKPKIGALRDQDSRNDVYCWKCHKEGSVICCELCPRVFHTRCLKLEDEPEGDWVCPVCQKVIEAECVDTQSKAMSKLSVGQLSRLLGFALKRMRHQGTDSFQQPVSLRHFPDYASYVFNPMDLGTLEENIKKRMYGSTYAFLEETKWILHNCIIFNGSHHKLTTRAKSIVDICNYEMNEIEICPSCYLSSSLKRSNWFCEPCDPPHTVVWAKLQGFPHWQAKVLRESQGQVDVRFFGAHDRAWIQIQNCFLLSEESPVTTKKNSAKLNTAAKEIKIHVDLIRELFGSFEYYPPRTQYKSGMCVLNTVQIKPSSPVKSPVRAIKPLSGKPAAFMNGIREAEAAKSAKEEDEISVSKEMETPKEDGGGGGGDDDGECDDDGAPMGGAMTRTVSESASIEEDSIDIDTISQDSSVWSMGSSFSAEKHDAMKTVLDNQDVDVVPVLKSRMGGGGGVKVSRMASVMSCSNPSTMTSEITRKSSPLSAKTLESTRKLSVTSDDSPSKSTAPAGIFEISDESLDIVKDKLGKSPAAQLLGKIHVSPKSSLNRNLSVDKSGNNTGSPPKKLVEGKTELPENLGPTGSQRDVCDKTMNKDLKQDGGSESSISSSKSAISPAGNAESSSASASSLQSILPSKLPDPSNLDEANMTASTPPESESLKVRTPRSSDKFHMNLSKTIETMKASLGMGESMESNEDSDTSSDTASMSGHDSDGESDSSEAHSEDESSMEVDAKTEAGTEKETTTDQTDGEKEPDVNEKTNNAAKTDGDVSKMDDDVDISKDAASSADGEESQEDDTRSEVKVQGSEVASVSDVKDQASEVASMSDGGLAMSLNSADDQSENELVIDMDRVDGDQDSMIEVEKASDDMDVTHRVSVVQDEFSDVTDNGKTKDGDIEGTVTETVTQAISSSQDNTAIDTGNATEMNQDGIKMPEIGANPGHTAQQIVDVESVNNSCNTTDTTVDVSKDDIPVIGENSVIVNEIDQTPLVIPQLASSVTVAEIDQTPLVIPQLLASQKLSEIALQSKLDDKGTLLSSSLPEMSSPVDSVDPSEEKMEVDTMTPQKTVDNHTRSKDNGDQDATGTQMDVAGGEVRKVEEQKGEEKKKAEERGSEEPEKCPWPEEDPLKAWGTADDLLEKYSTEVSNCVRDSLTTVRREIIDSITSVDIKTKIDQLQNEVSKLTWEKEQQKQELRHIMDLTVAEMRDSLNADLKSCETSTKKEAQKDKEDAIKETKRKQWCINCDQEAFFYCCWNTSYCTYHCQTKHWSKHQNSCQQSSTTSNNNNTQATSQPSASTATTITTTPTITNAADRLRIISSQASQIPPQNIQLVQATTHVTAAQNTGPVNAQSVQTLIRYVQAPPRMSLQPGATQQHQQQGQIFRLPVGQVGIGGNQMLRAVPGSIRQIGGQQQLVLTGQQLQSLQGKMAKLPTISGTATNIVNLGQKGLTGFLTNQ